MRTCRAPRAERLRARSPRPALRQALLVVWAIAGALASGAGAESLDEAAGRWQPAFSVGFGVQNQGFDARFDTGALIDGGLGVSGSDSASVLAPLFRFDGALHTPVITAGAGAPRLFVDAGAQLALSDDFAILRQNEEYARLAALPELCPIGDQVPIDGGNGTVGGCDHAGTADLGYDLSWYAGLGVEFTLPLSQRQFKLRPSVGYFGQSLQFDGAATRVDRAGRVLGGPQEGTVLRELSISASTDEIVHGLGPRLTLEVEAARLGAFSLNAFLETQLFWILSERDISFSGQSADGTVDFHAELSPIVAQAGAGLRVVWRGD